MTATKTKYTEEQLLQRLSSNNFRGHSLAVRHATTERVLLKALEKKDGRLIEDILHNPHATETVLLRVIQMEDWKHCSDVDLVSVINHPNATPKVVHAAVKAWVQNAEHRDPFVLAMDSLFAKDPLMRLQLAFQNAQDPIGLPFLH